MSFQLLIEHLLVFLSLKGGCIGSYESKLVKMSHCCKSHVVAYFVFVYCNKLAPGTISLIIDQALGDEMKLKCVF